MAERLKHKFTTWPFDRPRCLVCGCPWTKEYEGTECSGVYKHYDTREALSG